MSEKYSCDVLLNFSLLHVFVFFLMLCSRFYYFYLCYVLIYLFIYFYIYYNTNIMNLKLEYYSSKLRTFSYGDGTLFSEPRTSSLLNTKILYLHKINVCY
jgi:hypothetical protein